MQPSPVQHCADGEAEHGFSPDAFVQMAYQAAYFSLYGRTESTYEPAMMKAFLHGRTEAIRAVTPEYVPSSPKDGAHPSTDPSRSSSRSAPTRPPARRSKRCAPPARRTPS